MLKLLDGRGHKSMGEILSVHEALEGMLLPSRGRSTRSVSFYAAALGGVPESTIYQWCEGRMEMGASMVVPVTRAAQDFLLLDSMESACGRVGIPLPAGESLAFSSIPRVVGEFGTLTVDACKAIEDGRVTAEEAVRVRADGLRAIAGIWRLVLEMDRQCEVRSAKCEGNARARTLKDGDK